MFYTYILISESTGKLYIGQTNNLTAKVNRHNRDKNFTTKNKGLWKLFYHREFTTRSEAMIYEKKLKAYKSKEYIIDKINKNEL